MMEETQCIEHILGGDSSLYRRLVERYQTGLIIHCENMLKNRDDAEDIAQEAFLKAYNQLAHYAPNKGNFSTWLYRIATNLCIDMLRRNKRNVYVANIEELADATTPDGLDSDEIQQIRQAVNQLEPPKYAEIIKAYFWEGKSYQDLAVAYGTSTNTIGTWMSRAKKQLREALV